MLLPPPAGRRSCTVLRAAASPAPASSLAFNHVLLTILDPDPFLGESSKVVSAGVVGWWDSFRRLAGEMTTRGRKDTWLCASLRARSQSCGSLTQRNCCMLQAVATAAGIAGGKSGGKVTVLVIEEPGTKAKVGKRAAGAQGGPSAWLANHPLRRRTASRCSSSHGREAVVHHDPRPVLLPAGPHQAA